MRKLFFWMILGSISLTQTSCVSMLVDGFQKSDKAWADIWQAEQQVVKKNTPDQRSKQSPISIRVEGFQEPDPIFYKGMPNIIKVSASNARVADLDVSVSIGTLSPVRNEAGSYIYIPQNKHISGAEITVRNKKTEETFVKLYQVLDPPVPEHFLGKKPQSTWSAGSFSQQTEINSRYKKSLHLGPSVLCTCTGFRLIYAPKDGQRQEVTNEGNQFSAQTLALIQQAKSGDVYIFDQVKNSCTPEPTQLVYVLK